MNGFIQLTSPDRECGGLIYVRRRDVVAISGPRDDPSSDTCHDRRFIWVGDGVMFEIYDTPENMAKLADRSF